MTEPTPTPHKNRRDGEGLALGIAVGVAIGLLMNNLALGIGLGAGLGLMYEGSQRRRASKED